MSAGSTLRRAEADVGDWPAGENHSERGLSSSRRGGWGAAKRGIGSATRRCGTAAMARFRRQVAKLATSLRRPVLLAPGTPDRSEVIVAKTADHLPLHRQEKRS